jgi:hypothetical protein
MPRRLATLPVAALSLICAGCSQNVQVETTFPEPLVQPLPLTVGVHFTEALTHYAYSEELPADNADWTFNIGAANQLLFDTVFSDVFARTVPVATPGAAGVDAVVEPGIEAFEFSLPRHSHSNQYAVWISYTINVYGPDGGLRTQFPVKAYGEVDARRFKGNATMRKATVLAMRDAATIIIDSLNRDTGFRRAVFGTAATAENDEAPADLVNDAGLDDHVPETESAAVKGQPDRPGEELNSES